MSFRAIVIVSSLALLLIFITIAVQGAREAEAHFQQQLKADGEQLQSSFALAVGEEQNHMLLLASMIAAVPNVQALFYQGVESVKAEGGGPGGPEADRKRRQLYQQLAPMWHYMQRHHKLRQLHFHIPPATSFLRVHAPEHFGDSLAGLRHIIIDANSTRQAYTGFEIGRVYSGIRAIVPIWHETADGERHHVGSLEAGTAADSLLERLALKLDTQFALLLYAEEIENAVWSQFKPDKVEDCDCYLEASSDPLIGVWLQQGVAESATALDSLATRLKSWQGRQYSLVFFPFSDYRGEAPVGFVVGWQDVTEAWLASRQSVYRQIAITATAYLLTQLIWIFLLLKLRAGMQHRVDRATLELAITNDQLDSLLRDSPVVSYRVPVPGTAADYISSNCEQLLGYTPEEITGNPEWLYQHIHEDDLDAVSKTMDWKSWPVEGIRRRYRLRDKQGQWHWIEDRCRPMLSTSGRQALHGVLVDATRQHLTEQALKASERDLKRAQEAGHVGSWNYRFRDQKLAWSEEVYHIFKLPMHVKPDYARFVSLIHPDDRALVDRKWNEAMASGDYSVEHRIIVDDEVRWVRETADFEKDADGGLRAIGIVQDITEQKQREQELEHLATTDTLTGLANRRFFIDRLNQELSRSARFNSPCGLLMMDLDHFKKINDRYGHATGDSVLKTFARTAGSMLRSIDLLGRLGGEEFALLLPGTDIEGAKKLAERLRRAVAEIRFEDTAALSITISIGVTVITPDEPSGDAPLGRADKAMYRAKENGRNRVEVA